MIGLLYWGIVAVLFFLALSSPRYKKLRTGAGYLLVVVLIAGFGFVSWASFQPVAIDIKPSGMDEQSVFCQAFDLPARYVVFEHIGVLSGNGTTLFMKGSVLKNDLPEFLKEFSSVWTETIALDRVQSYPSRFPWHSWPTNLVLEAREIPGRYAKLAVLKASNDVHRVFGISDGETNELSKELWDVVNRAYEKQNQRRGWFR